MVITQNMAWNSAFNSGLCIYNTRENGLCTYNLCPAVLVQKKKQMFIKYLKKKKKKKAVVSAGLGDVAGQQRPGAFSE